MFLTPRGTQVHVSTDRQKEFSGVAHDFIDQLGFTFINHGHADLVVDGHLRQADGLVDVYEGLLGLTGGAALDEGVEGLEGPCAFKRLVGPAVLRLLLGAG